MSYALLATDDIHVLVRIFLAAFVLIGLLPHLHKSLIKILNYFSTLRRPDRPGMAASIADQTLASADPSHMDDIAYLVFMRLAQAGRKGLSPAARAESLYMDGTVVEKALRSLNHRGLVRIAPGFGIVRRLSLSDKGRSLAVARGLIPRLSRHQPDGRFSADRKRGQ